VLAQGAACSSSDETLASTNFQVSGRDFSGNSIRICGARNPAAEAGIACDSVLPDTASSVSVPGGPGALTPECPCFDFAADGTLIDPTSQEAVAVSGLCPSSDVPMGGWTFDYTIYSMGSCTGEIINTAANNFVCFDARDLLSQAHPNQSFDETLTTGSNANHILCLSANADKDWSFSSCALETTAADEILDQTRYNCGCAIQGSVCACDNVTAANLQAGCDFDPATCDIVCSLAAGFACTDNVFAAVDQGTSTDLFALDLGTSGLASLGTTTAFGYAALAFNPLDGLLYAISNTNASGDPNPHLIRIDHLGVVTDLGSSPALVGHMWVDGTFLADGTYLIGDAAVAPAPFQFVKLSIVPMQPIVVIGTGAIPVATTGPSMWAAHPTNGLVYGYVPQAQRLSVFNPVTNTLTLIGPTIPAIGPHPCSGAFEKNGTLALYCATSGLAGDHRFDVDVTTSAATPVPTDISLSSASLTSCVFAP
jgi:hypothetical protein